MSTIYDDPLAIPTISAHHNCNVVDFLENISSNMKIELLDCYNFNVIIFKSKLIPSKRSVRMLVSSGCRASTGINSK